MMVCGGRESTICALNLAGVCKKAGILILKQLEHTKKQDDKIYTDLSGFGVSCDAYYSTNPPLRGAKDRLCLQNALANARLKSDSMSYINAHMSTLLNDLCESQEIKDTFRSNTKTLANSSTKGRPDHCLESVGAVGDACPTKSMFENIALPKATLKNIDQKNIVNHCSSIKKDDR